MDVDKYNARKRRWHSKHKEEINSKRRAYRAANKDKVREWSRKSERKRKLKRYGLTEEAYETLLNGQDNKCAICKTDGKDTKRDWHVDHDHKTGKVRGILCHHCNLMLGNARDNLKILQEGINYLGKHKKKST